MRAVLAGMGGGGVLFEVIVAGHLRGVLSGIFGVPLRVSRKRWSRNGAGGRRPLSHCVGWIGGGWGLPGAGSSQDDRWSRCHCQVGVVTTATVDGSASVWTRSKQQQQIYGQRVQTLREGNTQRSQKHLESGADERRQKIPTRAHRVCVPPPLP